VRWADASRARRAVELEKIGTTTQLVLLDLRDAARDNPALADELSRCKSDDERERLAFEWFEDHPQPTQRRNWLGWRTAPGAIFSGSGNEPTFQTPDWPGGRLPPLDEAPAEEDARRDRYGKDYPGPPVEEVVRLAHAAQLDGKRLARTLRNKLAKETGVSPYGVELIFRLMARGLLADAGRKGWLKVAGQPSATPAFINLHELETRS
jgi:hypothetical protein